MYSYETKYETKIDKYGIARVYESGHYVGSFFTRSRIVKEGACVSYGVNYRYLYNVVKEQ